MKTGLITEERRHDVSQDFSQRAELIIEMADALKRTNEILQKQREQLMADMALALKRTNDILVKKMPTYVNADSEEQMEIYNAYHANNNILSKYYTE